MPYVWSAHVGHAAPGGRPDAVYQCPDCEEALDLIQPEQQQEDSVPPLSIELTRAQFQHGR